MSEATCRLCRATPTETFVDLRVSSLCESFVSADRLGGPATFSPLNVRICSECLSVQRPASVAGEDIFSDFAFFSSYSDSWVEHARRYSVERLERGADVLDMHVAGFAVGVRMTIFQDTRPPDRRRMRRADERSAA